MKLWNLDGKNLQTLKGHSDDINSVAFSRDGNIIATASSDTTVKLWNLDGSHSESNSNFDDLVKIGCNWVRDYLTNNTKFSEQDKHVCNSVISED